MVTDPTLQTNWTMMMRKISRWSGAALTILTMGACEDTLAPDAFDEALLLDAAVVAADATLEDIGIMHGAFGFPRHNGPGLTDGNMGNGPSQPGGRVLKCQVTRLL